MSEAKQTPTKLVRVKADLCEMLSVIVWYDREAVVPDILDPLIRAEIERRFAEIPETFRQTALARPGRPQPATA